MADTKNNWGDWLTPDLASNPGLAYDVSRSSNPIDLAPVVSHAVKTTGTQTAIDEHISENDSSSFWDKLGAGTLKGLEFLNKGIQETKRDYKFIHSVYTNHGLLQGFEVTLGVIGGAVGGTLVAGPVGGLLGAEAAAASLRKVATVGPWASTYQDSVKDSENPDYKVSAGRDFSNVLAQASDALGVESAAKAFRNTNAGVGKVASGGVDLLYTINLDPTIAIAKFGTVMRAGKMFKKELDAAGEIQVKYPLYKAIPGAKDFMASRTSRVMTSEQMDAVRDGSTRLIGNQVARTYNRALDDIAGIAKAEAEGLIKAGEAAGTIAVRYPQLGAEAAGHLSKVTTADGVHNWLKTALYFGEQEKNLAGAKILPQRTLLRAVLGDRKVPLAISGLDVAKYIKDADSNWVENPAWKQQSLANNTITRKIGATYNTFTGYMPYSIDAETGKLSTQQFKWDAPDATSVIYRIAKFGMGEQGARIQAGKYAEAVASGDFNMARIIKNNTYFETFKALGLPDNNALVLKIKEEIDNISNDTISGQIYGVSPLGEAVGRYTTANGPRVGGVFEHHAQEMFNIPNFNAIKSTMRDLGKLSKVYGKLDEFTSDQYTNRIFKPLALLTTGFGIRIAASEMIPAVARYGFINTFKAGLGKAAAKSNTKVDSTEKKHILAAVLVALGSRSNGALIALGSVKTGLTPDTLSATFGAFKDAAKRGFIKAAELTAPEQLELATRLIITNEGHILKEAVRTGHGSGESINHSMESAANYFFQIKQNNSLFKDLPEYTFVQAESPYYIPQLQNSINIASRDKAQKNIATDLVASLGTKTKSLQVTESIDKAKAYKKYVALREGLIQKELLRMQQTKAGTFKDYKPESKKLSRWNDGDLRQFAADRVDATLGKFIGQDGTVQRGLINNVITGKETSIEDLINIQSGFPLSLPKMVESKIMINPPSKNFYDRAINYGFKKMVDPIINNITREPLYLLHVADELGYYSKRIADGHLTEDQALRFAQQRAVYAMVPQIHNVALRSQFAVMARNILPFYFAQEQAVKRAFATLKDTKVGNPAFSTGLRYFQIAEQTLNDPGFVQTDSNGGKYLTLPGVGAFGETVQAALARYGVPMVANLPVNALGSLTSLKTVLPELQAPGVTPFTSIGLNRLANFFPATKSIIKPILGDIGYKPSKFDTNSIADAMFPSTWMKNVWRSLTLDERDAQVANAITSALASAYYHEQFPGQKDGVEADAVQQELFLEKIKVNVSTILMLKAALNILSPLAPRVTIEDSGFAKEWTDLTKSKKDGGKGLSYADALQTFIKKHGASAVSYTVSKTEATMPDVNYPLVTKTIDFINKNKTKFEDPTVSTGYYFLIPQKTEETSSYEVFSEMISKNLRTARQPKELMKQFYIAQGEYAIAAKRKDHYDKLNAYKANFDTYSQGVEATNWSNTLKEMKHFFPTWYTENAPGAANNANAQRAYEQLNAIFANPATAPKHEQALAVKELLDSYNHHASQMAGYANMNVNGYLPSAEKTRWSDYLFQLAETNPELKTVIYGVFNKLG
jgi:hypothetical protein